MNQHQRRSHIAQSPARERLLDWTVGRRWWAGTLVMYLITRIGAILGFVLAGRTGMAWPSEWYEDTSLGPWRLMTEGWDGRWYTTIASQGYPRSIPLDAAGEPVYSPLAFYPLFPWITRLISATGLPLSVASVLLPTLLGLILVFLVRRLLLTLRPDLAEERAWFLFTAPLVVAAFPAAGVYSANYSEALAVVLLVLALLALVRRQYLALCFLILLLGLSRPLAVPLGLVILVHFWPQIVAPLRRRESVPWATISWFMALSLVSLVSVALWPLLVWALTGEPDGLFIAQSAWPRPGSSEATLPFSVVLAAAGSPIKGVVAILVLIGWTVALCRVATVRSLGPELVVWTVGYVAFILATVGFGASFLRYLLPALGLLVGMASAVKRPLQAATLLTVLTVLQCLWVWGCWSSFVTP